MFVTICSKTPPFRLSDPLLPQLRAIRDGKKPDSLFGVLMRDQEPYGGASDPDYDKPLGGISIRLRSGEEFFQTKSDSNGNYSFSGLLPGRYSVSADLLPTLSRGSSYSPAPCLRLRWRRVLAVNITSTRFLPGKLAGALSARMMAA